MRGTIEGDTIREEIVVFIVGYIEGRGFPPSVREIGEAVGLASPSTVHLHLRQLEADGRLSRVPGLPRAIRVLVPEKDGE